MTHTIHTSFTQRLKRLMRHWRLSASDGRRAFPPATLEQIAAAIAQGERMHRAEVRLIVETSLGTEAIVKGVSNRQRALALFAEYGIWDTEENCGVLIYVNLAERKVEIVADRAISRKIDAQQWRAVCQTMTQGFGQKLFHDATLMAISQLNALLQLHFPATGAGPRANQLPDQPIIL